MESTITISERMENLRHFKKSSWLEVELSKILSRNSDIYRKWKGGTHKQRRNKIVSRNIGTAAGKLKLKMS